ncbi:MAG: adenylate/guanylate cyclase domain-containing protein [Hyphomicrobiales bacterium]
MKSEYVHYKDPTSSQIEAHLKGLEKCPGVCIFVDIVGSTNIKYIEPIEIWGKKLNNTFNFFSLLNDFPEHFVKGIGDELMLYIPDAELINKNSIKDYYSLLEEIYATLDNIMNFPLDDLFYSCKVAIHYCQDVYNLTYFKGFNDYYGIDIDLSARLMSKAVANRIVLSEAFYKKVLADKNSEYHDRSSLCLRNVSDKYIEDFKGVPHPTEYRIINLMKL